MGRRQAVSQLNALAVSVGLSSIPVKTTQYQKVERLMRQLQPRCQEPQVASRPREAAEAWVANRSGSAMNGHITVL